VSRKFGNQSSGQSSRSRIESPWAANQIGPTQALEHLIYRLALCCKVIANRKKEEEEEQQQQQQQISMN
jgi:hypothetical protein